jgi:hypothetical protein
MSAPADYLAPFRDLLMPNARLLVQAGAGDGSLAREYRKLYPASATLVVEADPAQARRASEYAERVYQNDLDTVSAAFYKQLEWADGWYFDATLEQYADPLRVLQHIRKVIQYDASIVARITNRAYWDAPAAAPRHQWVIADMLALFASSGFRVVSGVLLNPGPLPAEVLAALQAQAAQGGAPLEALIEAAQPSHYLIKAMPA